MRIHRAVASGLVALAIVACGAGRESIPSSPSVVAGAETAASPATAGGVAAQNAWPIMVLKTDPVADDSTLPHPTISGSAPLTVTFNLCRSSDPDQNPIDPAAGDTLNWQFHFGDSGKPVFDDEGRFNADVARVCRTEHTYEEGTYVAAISVTDKNLHDQAADVASLARVTQYLTIRSVAPAPTPTPTPTCTPTTSFVGNLDGTSAASAFEIGTVTLLPTQGWVNVSGSARIFDGAGGNGALIGTGPYTNYAVLHDTGVAIQASTSYALHFDLGYLAGLLGGNSSYLAQLGTVTGGIFTALAADAGSVAHAGNLSGGIVSGTSNLTFVTGSSVSGHNLAVRWEQTASLGTGSDFFGFDNVTLAATRCTP